MNLFPNRSGAVVFLRDRIVHKSDSRLPVVEEQIAFDYKAAVGIFVVIDKLDTVSVTAGSATVNFSASVLDAADPYRYVQVSGVSEWFTLTRVSGTQGTLSSAWPVATNATATYEIVYPIVTFGTNVLAVLRLWREGFPALVFAGTEHQTDLNDILASGTPTRFAPFSMDTAATSPSDDLLRYILLPPPSEALVLQYAFLKRPALLAVGGATTQVMGVPEAFNEAIITGVLFYCWDQEDKQDRSRSWKALHEEAMREALADLGVVSRYADLGPAGLWVEETAPIGG